MAYYNEAERLAEEEARRNRLAAGGVPQLPPAEKPTGPQMSAVGTNQRSLPLRIHDAAVHAKDVLADVVGGAYESVKGPVSEMITGEKYNPNPTPTPAPTIGAVGAAETPTAAFGFLHPEGGTIDTRDGVPNQFTRVPAAGYRAEGPGGSFIDSPRAKREGGNFSVMSGPLPNGMSQDKWNSLSQDEASKLRTDQYTNQLNDLKATRERARMENIAKMDGREYDPTTGHIKGTEGPPLVIGETGGYGLLDTEHEKQRRGQIAFDNVMSSRKYGRRPGDRVDAAKAAAAIALGDTGEGKKPSLSDMIDLLKLQEQSSYHANSLGLDQRKALLEDQRARMGLGLDTQRTQSQIGETGQRMQEARQKQLDGLLSNSGLSDPMQEVAQGIAAKQPGLNPAVITSVMKELSGVKTGEPSGPFGLFGTKTWGEMDKVTDPSVLEGAFNQRLDQLRNAQRGQ